MNGLWKSVKLGDVVEVASGQVNPTAKPFCDMPHVGGDNIESDTGQILELKTAKELNLISGKFPFDEHDVLYSKIRPALNKVAAPDFKGICSADIYPIRPLNGQLCREYLVYLLRSKDFYDYAAKHSSRTNIPKINRVALLAYKTCLPPLPEQRRIAAILNKADAIRRNRVEGVRLTEELQRSAFLEMFGDPVANPKDWDVDKLGNVITFIGGSQPPKETFRGEAQEGYVRLVQIRDFKTDKYQTYIPKELARRSFENDDVMIARYGPPVFQILRGLSGSYNVALMKAQPTQRTTKDFIFYLLKTPAIHDTVVENSSRTAGQSGVNLDLLNNLEIPIPPVSIQQTIGLKMRRIEEVNTLRQQALQESEGLFGTLVQRAFRGAL